jgi:hypothetical protein
VSMVQPIPTYVINLKERADRLEHVKRQFQGRKEFELHIVEAIKHKIGAIGLWETMKHILRDLENSSSDYVILCEDDHLFTEAYNSADLFVVLNKAIELNADILLGGPSWVNGTLPVSENIFWVEKFTGTQFTIVFRKFFNTILEADFLDNDCADAKMADLTQEKFFIYPFLSIQRDFGYSDVTLKNNKDGYINDLYKDCSESILLSGVVRRYYSELPINAVPEENFENFSLPAYIICSPERPQGRTHIENEFRNRTEFTPIYINESICPNGKPDLWQTICGIMQKAIENDDDVIIISEDDHAFTNAYSRNFLLRNILESHQQKADYLSGGSSGFGLALPITKNRFWINSVLSFQFIVLYRCFFEKILSASFGNELNAGIQLSDITSKKMILFPFISTKKDIKCLDKASAKPKDSNGEAELFIQTEKRLEIFQKAYLKYS